jgi:hypothetical protein
VTVATPPQKKKKLVLIVKPIILFLLHWLNLFTLKSSKDTRKKLADPVISIRASALVPSVA